MDWAAAQGRGASRHMPAKYCEDGLGVQKNTAKALKRMNLAAGQNYTQALYALSFWHREGIGVEKDRGPR